MATGSPEYPKLVYINPDGSIKSGFCADFDAVPFLDYGDYLIPWAWRE